MAGAIIAALEANIVDFLNSNARSSLFIQAIPALSNIQFPRMKKPAGFPAGLVAVFRGVG
ncbi:hypothetical protein AGMMS49944_14570 [Spirochaetia bacterium]|nr:hypothetical protein AGMMS49944_14570 [Spirochaetia bacterium]